MPGSRDHAICNGTLRSADDAVNLCDLWVGAAQAACTLALLLTIQPLLVTHMKHYVVVFSLGRNK